MSLFNNRAPKPGQAKMELVSWNKPGPFVDIAYAVQWKNDDGSVRIPEAPEEKVFQGSQFSAAGKSYSSWQQLCAEQTVEPYAFIDKYGRQVFAYKELFPCFDSYDYLNENRYYRWFYILEADRLSCVYLADDRGSIKVTEEGRMIKDDAWKAMQETNWNN